VAGILEALGYMILGAAIALSVKLAIDSANEGTDARLLRKVLVKLEALRQDLREARKASTRSD